MTYDEKGRVNLAPLDWSKCPDVESIPGKLSGAWVLKGTRMPVSAIFENLAAGASIDDIMNWFDGLDREQIIGVIEFAARSLDKEPAFSSSVLILFDQGRPLPIRSYFKGHSIRTASEQGWDRLTNGELLDAAEQAGFELFITTNKNIRFQQNLSRRKIATIVLAQQQ